MDTIQTQRVAGGTLVFLPLPPSTNDRTMPVRIHGHVQQILTKEARQYRAQVGLHLKIWCRQVRYAPISGFRYLDTWFTLTRVGADSHNYFKVLCDALEEGGVVTNDRFLLPRVQGIWHDTKDPHVAVLL